MPVNIRNCVLVDVKRGRFGVLGIVQISLPAPWLWQAEDISSDMATGSIFRAYEKGSEYSVGYILVVDVTNDPSEPDVSKLTAEDAITLEESLRREIRREAETSGRTLVKWSPPHLDRLASLPCLHTSYVLREEGGNWQQSAVRIKAGDRKLILMATFNVITEDALEGPLLGAIKGASFTRELKPT
jgi:hypothetical protein